MSEEAENEVPAGAAVLPEIPAELGVHPLLLAVLHTVVSFAIDLQLKLWTVHELLIGAMRPHGGLVAMAL